MAEITANVRTVPERVHQSGILAAENVAKTFPVPDGELTVLEDVSFRLDAGGVVALLGRSASGKSTLLRILAGLIPPSRGRVLVDSKATRGANPGVAMFSRASRCCLGFRCRRMPNLACMRATFRRRLQKTRVGFARAFVMKPDVLMMDEPFSALDVLTAENLRGEISDLSGRRQFPAKSILLVTHNIEEAVMLSDRVVVLGANPGRIRGELRKPASGAPATAPTPTPRRYQRSARNHR